MGDEDIEKYVLETYRPLTSPDGKENWTSMQPFSVLLPPPVHGKQGVWVETALYHFSCKAIAKRIANRIPRNLVKLGRTFIGKRAQKASYIYGRWVPTSIKLGGGDSRKRMVMLGNMTQVSDIPPDEHHPYVDNPIHASNITN